MKKNLSIFILLLISAVVFLKTDLKAAEISVGATTWYTWWDFETEGNNGHDIEFDPEFLYGPALSVKLTNEFNLTFVFLYGKFEMEDDEYTNTITRMDGDLAFNYRLNNYFKIFAGGKYMGYKQNDGFTHTGVGSGIGISSVLPVAGNLFILGNFSGLYIWGNEEPSDNSSNENEKYNEYGASLSLSLAYYVVPASTTLSLGGRYQYFKTDYEDAENSNLKHDFYGITASATYSFNI